MLRSGRQLPGLMAASRPLTTLSCMRTAGKSCSCMSATIDAITGFGRNERCAASWLAIRSAEVCTMVSGERNSWLAMAAKAICFST